MNEHEDFKQLISSFIDGQLGEEEQGKVKEHLKTCDSCRKYAAELQQVSSFLREWPDESLSPDLEQKIHTTLHKQISKEGQTMKRSTKFITIGGGGIIAAVLVAMISLQVYTQTGMHAQLRDSGRLRKAADDIGPQFKAPKSALGQPQRSPAEVPQNQRYYLSTEYQRAVESMAPRQAYLPKEKSLADGNLQDYAVFSEQARIMPYPEEEPLYDSRGWFHTEEYDRIYENAFLEASDNPLSTFSIDVDTASYSNVRRFLNNNQMPPEDAVRIEEMINYFTYDYPQPRGREPFSLTVQAAQCPWNPKHQMALIGLQGETPNPNELPPSNLVFLIDVSGSMNSHNKLPLLKSAFKLMVERLSANERVAIVVYAGNAGLVLESTPGSNKQKILAAIDRLSAGGSTAGGAGVQLAYKIARENFIRGGNNRVILATDGDFNVGVSSDAELVRLIEKKRKEGIFLTVLGFGTGNTKDSKMEKLADKGNGSYYYIDTFQEAQKVLGRELGSTLFTIAKDVKIQIEFNPAQVKAYRLVGYENRILAKEDFHDDTKDAGELGAGHSVTALYEIVPADSDEESPAVDDLKYQRRKIAASRDLMTVKLRYKLPQADTSRLIQQSITQLDVWRRPKDDFQFAAAVAEFGLLLRNSEFKAEASYEHVLSAAQAAQGRDPFGYRAEFLELVKKAQRLDNRRPRYYEYDFDSVDEESGGIEFKGE